MNHSRGAPVRLTKERQEKLKQTIVSSLPHDVGFTARHNWTLEIIAAFIKREFGYTYSLRGVSKMMHRQGLSFSENTFPQMHTFNRIINNGFDHCANRQVN